VETKQQTETTGNYLITGGLMNGVQAPELQNFSFERRIQLIAREMGVTLEDFDYISTRGKTLSSSLLLPLLERKVRSRRYGAIILDSIYKLYPDDTDENSNSDIGRFLSGLERLRYCPSP
jgi:RecA-family ATPase